MTIHTLTQPKLQLIENKLKCLTNPLKAAIHITSHKKEIKNKIKQHTEIEIVSLNTTAHPWCGGHSTSISACGIWGVRAKVQISRREFHTHIHLD